MPETDPPKFLNGQLVVAHVQDDDGSEWDFEGAICEECPNYVYGIKNSEGNVKYFHAHGITAQVSPEPPVGSWAAVARLMAQTAGPEDDGFDWDAWKDEMKDREMGLYD